MSRRSRVAAYTALLVILALLSLRALAELSDGLTLGRVPWFPVAVIAVAVTFTTVVEVPLQGDGLSLGYAASLMALLALGQPNDLFTAISVIGAGGLFGGAIRALWRDWQARRRPSLRTVGWALIASAQLIVTFSVGAWLYSALGGLLPLTALHLGALPALSVLVGVSLAVYVTLYALNMTVRGLDMRRIFSDNRATMVVALFVPVPLMVAGALTIQLSLVGFIILTAGLLGLAVLATELGRQRLLFRQQVRELSSMSAVGRAVRANLDLDALLETIHLQVATLLEVDTFTLALYDPDRSLVTFPLAFLEGQARGIEPHPLGNDLTDYVIAQKAALLLESDVTARALSGQLTPPVGGLTTWLGVPLLTSDRALGCIAIGSNAPDRHFTADDRRLLSTIAAQSAISIDNAQLYRQAQKRSRQLETLNLLSTQMSVTLEPSAVFDQVVAAAVEITLADAAAIYLWTEDVEQTLVLARASSVGAEFRNDPPIPRLSPQQVSPVIVLDIEGDPRVESMRSTLEREGFTGLIDLPLRSGSDVIGVLAAYYRKPQLFSADEIEVLRAFANQAALSIRNARAYRRTDEALEQRIAQLSALASINQELASTLDLQHLFTRVLDYALNGTNSVGGALMLRPDASSGGAPRVVAQRSQNPRKTAEILLQQATTRALQTNQPVIDRSGLPELSVPIARDNDVMGVITLYAIEKDAYKADDVLFVRHLATQAVIAVDNARLFSRIEESRDRLQVILDSMHEAILLMDGNGTVLLANPQVNLMFDLHPARITGRTVESLLNESALDFASALGFTPATLSAFIAQMRGKGWPGGSSRQSYRIERPLVRFIDRTIVSTHASSGEVNGLLMVFADATEERELTQAREDLTRMIVHDLRAPLTAVSTSMHLLSEMRTADPALSKMLSRTTDTSQRALRKLLGLVDSLLDIAKMESGSMTLERADHMLAPIAQSVRIELLPLADELEIKVEVLIPDNLPDLFIDAPKIERVLLNLVDNALKFTPANGLVQICARRADRAGFARIDVIDSGPGIPDNYKVRIFDRFEQVDGSQGRRRGTGLGLTFCKLTVEAHGGQIWIEDNPKGGSVFAFTLPFGGVDSAPLKPEAVHEAAV